MRLTCIQYNQCVEICSLKFCLSHQITSLQQSLISLINAKLVENIDARSKIDLDFTRMWRDGVARVCNTEKCKILDYVMYVHFFFFFLNLWH